MTLHLRSAALGGTVAAVAVAGALIAGPVFASDTSTTPNPTATAPHAPDFDGDGPGWDSATVGTLPDRHGGPMDAMMGGRMLHSEGVVARTASDGTVSYVTVRNQSGKVTAASDSSITVKSDDGYTTTWPIASSTVVNRNGATAKGSAFVAGDVVQVAGTVDGDVVTTTVVSNGGPGRGRRGGMGHGPDRHSRGHLAPMPSASASSSSTNA